MAENRFFQSLCTLVASSVLVGGSLLLLTSTAPWTRPPQVAFEPSTPDSSPLVVEPSMDLPRATIDADQTRTAVSQGAEADPTTTASTGDEPIPAEAESTLSSDETSTEAGDQVAALDPPIEASDDASPEAIAPEGMVASDTAPEPDSTATDQAAPEAASVPSAEPAPSFAEQTSDPTDQAAPEAASVPQSEPGPSLAEQKTDDASDQIGDLLAGLPPRVIPSHASEAATAHVAEMLAATPSTPTLVQEVARPEPVAAVPPPPLPKRKPEDAPVAPQEEVAALPAPQQKAAKPETPKLVQRQELVRQEPTQPEAKGLWRPMGLAPADQPVPSQVPTARPSGAAYASSVWAALARHKPRAGQSGSTTVVFAIGGNGALRGLRVGRSSGNARIDQLALATVRAAAPFAPPPSGSASYTIRIDFH